MVLLYQKQVSQVPDTCQRLLKTFLFFPYHELPSLTHGFAVIINQLSLPTMQSYTHFASAIQLNVIHGRRKLVLKIF